MSARSPPTSAMAGDEWTCQVTEPGPKWPSSPRAPLDMVRMVRHLYPAYHDEPTPGSRHPPPRRRRAPTVRRRLRPAAPGLAPDGRRRGGTALELRAGPVG